MPMLKVIRAARHDDIDRVSRALSALTRNEMHLFFPGEPEALVLEAIRHDCATALGRGMLDAICLEDQATALVGLRKGRGGYLTSFFGTDRYFRADMLPISITYCRQLRNRLEGEVVALSRSSHPDTERWFRIMGFVFDGDRDGSRVFRLQ